MRSYEEIIEEIQNKRRFENLAGVEIAARMLEKLGDSCRVEDFIHIAGTNGKGSVSAFLRAILSAAGYRVGMFTSPHLVDFRERIQVDGQMIGKADVKRLGELLFSTDFGVHPTMFDYCLAMALMYFKEQQCDVVILETGLGGRLDSTNAVGVPAVSVITKIGFDHMAILGNTLAEIASEKAGILKKGTILVAESQEPVAAQVIADAAREAGVTDCRFVNPADVREQVENPEGAVFSFRDYPKLSMKMLGTHQFENAAAAILAAEAYFEKKGVEKKKACAAIRAGVGSATWQGRMEVVKKEPYFLLDGAHNGNGVAALEESLAALFPGEKFHFIMGVMADKDYGVMVERLIPLALDFVTVTVESARALQSEELSACIREKGVAAWPCEKLEDCLDFAKWDTNHRTVAFGSLYFIGEIKAYLQSR